VVVAGAGEGAVLNTTIFEKRPMGARRVWVVATPFLLIAFLLTGQILTLLPAKYSGLITKENVEAYPHILYMLAVSFSGAAAVLLLWIRYFERRSPASVGIVFERGAASRFARGYGVGLAMASAAVVTIWALGGYEMETPQKFAEVSYIPILLLSVGFIVQSSVEEILFRGWMLERISDRYGVWAGILGNSAMFTLVHVEPGATDPIQIANFLCMCFAFSIFLSLLVVQAKSVWGACAWHAAWNWVFITWFGLPTTGIALDLKPLWVDLTVRQGARQWLTGGATGPEDSIVTTVILIIGCAVLLIRQRRSSSSATSLGNSSWEPRTLAPSVSIGGTHQAPSSDATGCGIEKASTSAGARGRTRRHRRLTRCATALDFSGAKSPCSRNQARSRSRTERA
jgi:membrane protease YdiL (CAAX protease family)